MTSTVCANPFRVRQTVCGTVLRTTNGSAHGVGVGVTVCANPFPVRQTVCGTVLRTTNGSAHGVGGQGASA